MLNRAEFIGNLGRDPESRTMSSGDKVVNFSLAVSEKWTDKNGNRKDRTTWVPIVIWDQKLGEIAERYLRKGSKCYVAGEFSVRKWTDASGTEKYSTEIVLQRFRGQLVLLDSRGGSDDGDTRPAERPTASPPEFDNEPPF